MNTTRSTTIKVNLPSHMLTHLQNKASVIGGSVQDVIRLNISNDMLSVMKPEDVDQLSASSFYQWAQEDGSSTVENIAHPEKLKVYTPKTHVQTR